MSTTPTPIPSRWLLRPTLDVPIETAGQRGYRPAPASFPKPRISELSN